MSLRPGSALALVCLCAMVACTPEPRGLEWFVVVDADVGARMTWVEATIRRGSCTGEEVFRTGYRPGAEEMVMRPPVLEPGTWAFGARVHDASCAWIAEGCVAVALPFPQPVEVALTNPPSTPEACPASECRDGICEGVAPPMDADVPDDGVAPDTAPVDTGVPGCAMWTPQHFDACAIPAPGGSITIGADGSYDTTTGVLMVGGMVSTPASIVIDQGGLPGRVISVEDFSVSMGGTLRVVGEMPLIVASRGSIDIQGDLDASSTRVGAAGAGANPSACFDAMAGGSGLAGSGGGGGGGFHGNGGDGGRGNGNMLDGPEHPGGPGGGSTASPSAVRAGCNGADSGFGMSPAVAPGGAGGGAVQLTARGSITVGGRILAGGAGGTGGLSSLATGGGGGGSGGFIGLDAPTVTVTGTLAANGGGGGEGSNRSTTGGDGQDGRADDMRATGGAGVGAQSTDGGDGGAGTMHDGASVTDVDNGGGGGGGGGTGFVLIWSESWVETGALISPPAIVDP